MSTSHRKIVISGPGMASHRFFVSGNQLSPYQLSRLRSLDLGSFAHRFADGAISQSDGLLILTDGRVRVRRVSSDPRIYLLHGEWVNEEDREHDLA
jgi:hypothetical protein